MSPSIASYIKLLEIKDKVIMISTFKINNKILKILKRLNCTFFTERKTNKQLIILPFLKTKNKEENFEYAYSLLQNSLSIVNLYL